MLTAVCTGNTGRAYKGCEGYIWGYTLLAMMGNMARLESGVGLIKVGARLQWKRRSLYSTPTASTGNEPVRGFHSRLPDGPRLMVSLIATVRLGET
jgi:hypothetical protein